jgi:hypothetical protein
MLLFELSGKRHLERVIFSVQKVQFLGDGSNGVLLLGLERSYCDGMDIKGTVLLGVKVEREGRMVVFVRRE